MDATFARPIGRAHREDGPVAADALNRDCRSNSPSRRALSQALAGDTGSASLVELFSSRPHLFAETTVFVSEADLQRMVQIIDAVERVVARPAYRQTAFARAPAAGRHPCAAAGVFVGYDFHLGPQGPRLIEINSNAGGAMLNARLLDVRRACGAGTGKGFARGPVEQGFVDMFRSEWRLERGAGSRLPGRVAIVDERPDEQYLAPEFALFRELFEAHGIAAVIADPADLSFDGRRLWHRSGVVDLVYNRLTDFALADGPNAALLAAWLAGAVVLTPNPRTHALYADKRNLCLLGDVRWLAQIGVDEADRALLAEGIPRTCEVGPENAEEYWATRRQWFFKPFAGFGSKAAYRGDKLTRRAFAAISRGGYVAQAVVAPSERRLVVDGVEQDLKLDLRNYVYRGVVQLVAARLYRGQTTNFRTPGGGFAGVVAVPSGVPCGEAR
ncbi:hypothetical protein [Accumulibacter sp.]|uniref:hypothetical protein n=1 Tax=Accumulibacter sp. TaxID=2053492 RepID=UPI0025EA91D7|nr:hypothetical protein [Accumulibacter sp.]MCM8596428.1 hypothetical protein [Accumulibacter sp.]MDS4050577.1 hypothetical protein [Accumulibacter sp.]